MLYIRLENFVPVEVTTENPGCGNVWAFRPNIDEHNEKMNTGNGWISRWDIKSFAYANTMAVMLTEKLGRTFLATDAGEHCSPQYDVIEAPKIGDEVSRRFNGDSYPEGKIIKITPTWQITTSTGKKFRRSGKTGGWRETGRGFWMVGGHIDERNPSF